jgi:rhodanese-related sulfurtransferase
MSTAGNHHRYADLLADARRRVPEVMPWDLPAWLAERKKLSPAEPPLLLDVREPAEFERAHIEGSINVPRGVLEQACEWDFDETEPQLARTRTRAVVVICRSGNRSLLAADTLLRLGFTDVVSLDTGIRGWNDFDQPLVAAAGELLDAEAAEKDLEPHVRPDQRRPSR